MPAKLNFRQKAYQHVRSKLMAGEVRAGQRLSEVALAREIGISRTPMREALHQLASEGLLDRDEQGLCVKQITRADLLEISRLRRMLEIHAAGRAARQITDQELAGIRQVVQQLRSLSRQIRNAGMAAWRDQPIGRQMAMTDVLFHVLILQAANSPRTLKIVTDFRLLTMRYAPHSGHTLTNLSQTLLAHWRIYAALRRRDPQAARAAMRVHHQQHQTRIINAFDHERRAGHRGLIASDWSGVLESVSRRIGIHLDVTAPTDPDHTPLVNPPSSSRRTNTSSARRRDRR